MPLTQPSAGGLARKNILVSSFRNTNLTAGTIAWGAFEYDPINDFILAGAHVLVGTIPFVGTFPNFKIGILDEFPTSPNSVISNSPIISIHRNGVDGGVVILNVAGEFARTDDSGVTWTAVVPGSGNTEYDLNSWRNNQLVNFHRTFVAGADDLLISNDNGVTFPLSNFSGLAGSNRIFSETTDDDKIYIALGFAGAFSWTSDEDMATASFNVFPAGTFPGFVGDISAFAATGDSSKAIIGDDEGNIIVTIDGFQTWTEFDNDTNYFRDAGGSASPILAASYVADIDGFILIGTGSIAGFIPASGALDTMEVVNFMMINSQQPDTDEGSTITTDGIDMICISANTFVVMQLPFKN